jgi:tetratricopeptide (TPR) repeat protein
LGTLVPVIGLVQVGDQAMADRYTYVPLIGVFVMIAWGAAELFTQWKLPGWSLAVVASVVLALCLARTRLELPFWRDGMTIFTRALAINPKNEIAHHLLGSELFRQRDYDAAIGHFRESIRLNPRLVDPYHRLGAALANQGRYEEAIAQYQEALRRQPDDAGFLASLGKALANVKRYDEAAAHYQQALKLKPDLPDVHYHLAVVLASQAKYAESVPHFAEAARQKPEDAQVRFLFATACAHAGQTGEALRQYREALRLKPDSTETLNACARLLATHAQPQFRSGSEAVRLAEQAFALTQHRSVGVLDTLAASYAEAGRFTDAAAAQEKVVATAQSAGATNELPAMQARLKLYREGKPFREIP